MYKLCVWEALAQISQSNPNW